MLRSPVKRCRILAPGPLLVNHCSLQDREEHVSPLQSTSIFHYRRGHFLGPDQRYIMQR